MSTIGVSRSTSFLLVFMCIIIALPGFAQEGRFFDGRGPFQERSGLINELQQNHSNTAIILQSGPDFDQVILNQIGFYNRATIIQSANIKDTYLQQTGRFNQALVIQISDETTDIAVAVVRQCCRATGAINNATTIQYSLVSESIAKALVALDTTGLQGVAHNFIFAPETVRAPVEVVNTTSQHFLDNLSRWPSGSFSNDCSSDAPNHRHSVSVDNSADNTAEGVQSPADPASSEKSATTKGYVSCSPIHVFALSGYQQGQRKARLGVLEYDYDGAFGLMGIETPVAEFARVGAALQYTRSQVDFDTNPAESDMDTFHIGLFSHLSYNHFFFTSVLAAGRSDIDIHRRENGLDARAKPDATTYGLSLQGGYLYPVNDVLSVGPVIGMQYTRSDMDDYQESGDVLITQSVHEQRDEIMTAHIGIHLDYSWKQPAVQTTAFFTALLEHDFDANDSEVIETAFDLDPDAPVYTPFEDKVDDFYGRFSGGISILNNARGLELTLSASRIFYSKERESSNVQAQLGFHF